MREVIHTRFGTVHLLALIAFAAFLVLAVPRGWAPVLTPGIRRRRRVSRRQRFGRVELALMGALGRVPRDLAGARRPRIDAEPERALLIPTDVLHVTAMSVWVGGLLVLLAVLPVATRALEPPDRTRLLAATLLRFSPMALIAVCAICRHGPHPGIRARALARQPDQHRLRPRGPGKDAAARWC